MAYILKKERVLGYLISLFNIQTVLTDKIIWKILSNWYVLLMILTMQIIHVHAHANANLAYMYSTCRTSSTILQKGIEHSLPSIALMSKNIPDTCPITTEI